MDQEIIIKPVRNWLNINWKELWRYRELFYIFTWRDIKVRYKQTIIGILWVVLQPLAMMVIFTIFFGVLAKIPSQGAPYPIFVYTGLLFWNYFSSALTGSSNSLIDSQEIIKKVYFPRLILPVAAILSGLVDLVISFLVLIILMVFYHYTPHLLGLLLMPILVLMTFLLVSGLGLLFSSINIKYRDVRYVIPFLVQLLFFVTPVIYPPTLVPQKYAWVLSLNPMTGIISAARNGIVGVDKVNWLNLGISAVIILFILIIGLYFFRKTERYFADVV